MGGPRPRPMDATPEKAGTHLINHLTAEAVDARRDGLRVRVGRQVGVQELRVLGHHELHALHRGAGKMVLKLLQRAQGQYTPLSGSRPVQVGDVGSSYLKELRQRPDQTWRCGLIEKFGHAKT
jgi:hypothetical protein